MPATAFATGASYLVRAADLLARDRTLWRYLATPVAVSLAFGLALYIGLVAVGSWLVGVLMASLPLWLNPIGIVINLVLMVLLLWVSGVAIAKFGVILGSPWYGQLAEHIERAHLPASEIPEAPEGLAQFVGDIGLALLYELKKLGLMLAIGVPALLLNLVPGVGSVAAGAVWGALGVTTLVLDFLDPALQRRRLRFRRKLAIVLGNAPTSAGFGIPALFLAGIPLVNLLTVPLCMTAGTLYYIDRVHPQLAAAGQTPALPSEEPS